MKRRPVILVVVALLLAACGGAASTPAEVPSTVATKDRLTESSVAAAVPSPTPIVLTDGTGREVSLERRAERIVSLAPSNTEILFAIGAGDLLVGRDDFSDYPPEVEEVTSIGSTYGGLNTEAIIALEPDLVLAAGITPPEHIQSMDQLGVRVFALGNPMDFEGLFKNLTAVGTLTGHRPEALALVEDLRSRVEAVAEALEGVERVPIFYEVDASDPSAPWTTGSGTFQQHIFELAAGENIAADLEGWLQLSLEEIVVRDPDVIIFGAGPFVPTTVESLKLRPGWGGITAVREDRVYAVDTDLLDLPGPRLVEGLEAVAWILHPDRFDG